jgi:hypothetical protein
MCDLSDSKSVVVWREALLGAIIGRLFEELRRRTDEFHGLDSGVSRSQRFGPYVSKRLSCREFVLTSEKRSAAICQRGGPNRKD